MIEYYKHIKRLQHRSVSLKHLKFRDRDIELLELSQVEKKKKEHAEFQLYLHLRHS